MFQTRFKCFKRIANIQHMLLMFQARCEYSKHFSNVSNALIFKTRVKCFKRVANIQLKHVSNVSNALLIFKTRCKC